VVVDELFGFTEALRVTEVEVKFVVELVVTVGGINVAKLIIVPLDVPTLFCAAIR
jgi:hypothetical protein